jgi:predicted RNA binding protein YcfA (HicA-like mRNA interferase family)
LASAAGSAQVTCVQFTPPPSSIKKGTPIMNISSRRDTAKATPTSAAAYRHFFWQILVLGLVLIGAWSIARAQDPQAKALPDIVGMKAEEGQKKLESLGFEIVYAKGSKQYWWNEKDGTCLDLRIKGKKIEKLVTIDDGECESRVAAARKVWEAYADGQANVHGPELDQERARFAADGYQASFWVKNISADKANSIEYWFNESANKCAYIVFRTSDGKFLSKDSCEAGRCKNPAPKH